MKEYRGFKVGELVEQTKSLDIIRKNEHPLCKIISFIKYKGCIAQVRHRHMNKSEVSTASIGCFKKIPKLKRLLLYGV